MFSFNYRSAFFIIACILSFSFGQFPAFAQSSGIDLALAINGSGSISSTDFALQKEGIKLALQDPLLIQRDGSVAITVVQYANGITQVHVPYTVINSNSDINNVVGQINSIVQINGSTNPGDGINTVMSVLNSSGNPANEQILCLSTDGLPNSGADVATALNNAQASPIGLERFSVIAIEDLPMFSASDFQNFYGPLVFGGGAVTVTRNSAEYANMLGSTCLAPRLKLIGLEVIQTIQDWNNSVRLIANKTTYIRAHIEPIDGNPIPARARLRGFRNNVELPGSLVTATNPGGSITALSNAANRRSDFNASLNFEVPATWLNGTIRLQLDSPGLDCSGVASVNQTCSIEVSFEFTEQLEIKLVDVQWPNHPTPSPSDHLDELDRRLRSIYPIASGATGLDSARGQLQRSSSPSSFFLLNISLHLMRLQDECWSILGCNRIYYGVVPRGGSGGRASFTVPVASGVMPTTSFVYGRNTHAHEIGHVLGRLHPMDVSPLFDGPCGEDAGAPGFPYLVTIGGREVAALGPIPSNNNLADNNLIYGLDTNPSNSIRVVDPFETFELMSYCRGTRSLSGGATDTSRWISKFTYEAIQEAINSGATVNLAASNNLVQDYLIVRGYIDLEENSAQFVPFSRISSATEPPGLPSGDYTLQLSDATGNVIKVLTFEPVESDADFPTEGRAGLFTIPVQANPAIHNAAVLFEGNEMASITRSSNPPSLELIFPNGGENLSSSPVNIQWQGSDPDNDPLTYLIQFSPDGGITWETLAADWPEQSYEIALDFLGETTNGLIRVMASDGFNVAMDVSDGVFSTPNVPPSVSIFSPQAQAAFSGVQLIVFRGLGQDREDGILSDNQLSWTSDRDGFLGTGEVFNLEATQLSEGEHIITLSAVDSKGLVNTDTVTIGVSRIFSPPINTPTIDIKPGSDPNSINCKVANGVIPVAILTTAEFDATTVDHTTVRFEGATESHRRGRQELVRHEEDVDQDGDVDLVFHFRLRDTTLDCDSTEGTLTGTTFDGVAVSSTDAITMRPGNTVPQALNDNVSVNIDMAATIDVLSNDTDEDGDVLTVISVATPPNGTTEINPDGTITYTPDSGFEGVDSFSYAITDGKDTTFAAVTVIVGQD